MMTIFWPLVLGMYTLNDDVESLCICVRIVCPQGVSLAQAKEKGQLIFLEGLKESLSILNPQETNTASQAMDFLRYKQIIYHMLYDVICCYMIYVIFMSHFVFVLPAHLYIVIISLVCITIM